MNRNLLGVFISLAVMAFIPLSAHAIPTYDGNTGILTLEMVKTSNGEVYADVIVTVDVVKVHEAKAVQVKPDPEPDPEPAAPPEIGDPFDDDGNSVGKLPGGGTCFLGVTPGCVPFDTVFDEPDPDPDNGLQPSPIPDVPRTCYDGFGPPIPCDD